jgi:hypothetical protein
MFVGRQTETTRWAMNISNSDCLEINDKSPINYQYFFIIPILILFFFDFLCAKNTVFMTFMASLFMTFFL